MTNDEDLARIRQGAAVWNDWRVQHRERRVDLSWGDLREANLRRTATQIVVAQRSSSDNRRYTFL